MNAPITRTTNTGTSTNDTAPAPPAASGMGAGDGSAGARDLRWLLNGLVDEVPGIRSVVVVSSDGLLLLSSDPRAGERPPEGSESGRAPASSPSAGSPSAGSAAEPGGGPRGSSADLATIVSGVGSLTMGAAKLMDGGAVRQTMVAMNGGSLFVMAISDGSLLGVHADRDCDMNLVAYRMALFVGRAGHVLTPELRSELRSSMEADVD